MGGVVEVEAGPEIGKVSGVCVHSNNLRRGERIQKTGRSAVSGRIAKSWHLEIYSQPVETYLPLHTSCHHSIHSNVAANV